MNSLSVVTDSTGEPLSTAEVRDHVRGSTEDNTLIDSQVVAARQLCETITGRSFMRKKLRYSLEAWPRSGIDLPRPVNASSTAYPLAVTYRSQGSTSFTTFASTNYLVDNESEPGRLTLKYGAAWPSGALESGQSVRVDFWSGASSPAGVSQGLKQAILLLSGSWYENRESVVVGTISSEVKGALDALLWAHKIPNVP